MITPCESQSAGRKKNAAGNSGSDVRTTEQLHRMPLDCRPADVDVHQPDPARPGSVQGECAMSYGRVHGSRVKFMVCLWRDRIYVNSKKDEWFAEHWSWETYLALFEFYNTCLKFCALKRVLRARLSRYLSAVQCQNCR